MSAVRAMTEQSTAIEVRLAPDLGAVVRRAAELQQPTLDDFIVTALIAEAEETIRGREELLIQVSPRAYEQILVALSNPPPSSEALREAFRDYLKFIGETKRGAASA